LASQWGSSARATTVAGSSSSLLTLSQGADARRGRADAVLTLA
jgi:hypothetical protein